MLCDMESTFQACMQHILQVPKHFNFEPGRSGQLCHFILGQRLQSSKRRGLKNNRPSVFIKVVQVTKIDSTDRVRVQWVDGSESQFNVHPTGFFNQKFKERISCLSVRIT